MKKGLEYIRIFVLSGEFTAIVLAGAVYLFQRDWLVQVVTAAAAGGSGVDMALFFAPFAPGVLAYHWSDDLLNPPEKKLLIDWPDYWRLRARVWAALTYILVGIVAWLTAFLLVMLGGKEAMAGGLLLGAGTVILIATASVGLARLVMKEVLAGV